ncbi:hypothetical protein PTSG_05703 [Salpingoeca rosetta]|uniref:EF-hand domain-containing protein n=1 Tax=Salpingoeca rosetta (strain ATCC 50818 / BSB-021) TaxID=946362 RepID=F2UAZ2_SALR5|nr:uncharacterized protein PTSG_05703 [Salpingoeca rosetta]EGD74005.1 hypothetical protein PTSG_05703 [Salpingoeca rosetta]|eukprot:XP_004993568.1 hypothetical protein PTSG_05703 [Salpingoeca rosetta]
MAARTEKQKEMEALSKATHFSEEEVQRLINFFETVASNGKLDRNAFRDVLHEHFNLTEASMMDRLFRAFTNSAESTINKHDWVMGMSLLLRGTLDEQIDFVYRVYTNSAEDYATKPISRDTMFFLLKNTMVKIQNEEERDEGIKELVDLVLKKMDVDHDGKLSLQDYRESVMKDPLLLEALGDCLPNEGSVRTFMQVVMNTEPPL